MKSALRLFIGFSFGSWINAFLSVVSIPIITWLISPSEFGKATMFTIAYNLILNFVLLGSDQSFIRFFNEKDNNEKTLLFKNSLISPLVFLLFISLVLILFKEHVSIALFSSIKEVNYVYALIVSLSIGIFLQFGMSLVRMKSKAVEYSSLQILLALSNIILIIGYSILVQGNFESIIIGFIGSSFVTLCLGIYYERSFWIASLNNFWKIDTHLISQIFLYGLPFVPIFLADWVFQSTDRTFLRIYSTYTEIGLFAAGTKVANSLNIIKSGFTAYWVPFSYEKFAINPSETAVYKKVFNLLSLVFFSFVIILISFAELVLSLLPESYAGTSQIFPILFFVPLLYTLSEITCVGINFKKKPYFHLVIVIISAVTNLVFGFILIPNYGALGAAISTLIAYVVYFCLRTIISNRLYYVDYNWYKFIASFLLAMVVLFLHMYFKAAVMIKILNLVPLIIIILIYRKDLQEFINKLLIKKHD